VRSGSRQNTSTTICGTRHTVGALLSWAIVSSCPWLDHQVLLDRSKVDRSWHVSVSRVRRVPCLAKIFLCLIITGQLKMQMVLASRAAPIGRGPPSRLSFVRIHFDRCGDCGLLLRSCNLHEMGLDFRHPSHSTFPLSVSIDPISSKSLTARIPTNPNQDCLQFFVLVTDSEDRFLAVQGTSVKPVRTEYKVPNS